MPSALVQFSTDDLKTPDGIERVLRQFQTALIVSASTASPAPVVPTVPELVNTLAPLLRNQLQAPGAFPLNLQSLLPTSLGSSVFTEDTHANRLVLYSPPVVIGTVFFEVDRTVTYVVADSSGTLVWRYASGGYVSIFANRPADLGVSDSGFLFYATDQDTIYIWTGAAWDTISRRILLGGFFAIFTHANTVDRTYTFPDADGTIVFQTATLTANQLVIGAGTSGISALGTLGTTTTVLHGNAGGAPTFSAVVLTTDVSGILPAANGGTAVSYNRIAHTLALTAQVAAIGASNFSNVVAPGTYRVSYSLLTTTLDVAAGSIQLNVGFTDDAGATTVNSAALLLTSLGRTTGVFYLQLASGNVTYATTLVGIIGTATYALYVSFERLS